MLKKHTVSHRPQRPPSADVERIWPPATSQYMLRLISEHCADMLSVHNEKDEFLFVSSSAAELLGWPARQLVGRTICSMAHPDDASRLAAERRNIESPNTVRSVYRLQCRSGRYRWVESRSRICAVTSQIITTTREFPAGSADIDGLDGISDTRSPEREATARLLSVEFLRALRRSSELSVALFTPRRERANGSGGPDPLSNVLDCIGHNTRNYDLRGRWNGDTCLLALPDTDCFDARSVAIRVRDALSARHPALSVALGVSSTASARSVQQLVSQAQTGLH